MSAVRFVIFIYDAVREYLRRNCSHSAGAIAFYTLFSMFPLFLFLTIALSYVFGPETAEEEIELVDAITAVIPVSHSFVGDTVHNVTEARDEVAIVSFLGVVWASTAMFGAIRKGVNNAWGIREPRPFLKERLIDFGLVWTLVPKLITPVPIFFTFLAMYRYLPNSKVRVRDVWPWALIGSLVFNATSMAFVWYVSTFPHYNVLYGSIGAVLALLTWVYLSATIVLFGALVSSRYCSYVASVGSDRDWRMLWGGFSRVRLRVVETSWPA